MAMGCAIGNAKACCRGLSLSDWLPDWPLLLDLQLQASVDCQR
jgi:hypothetical protein